MRPGLHVEQSDLLQGLQRVRLDTAARGLCPVLLFAEEGGPLQLAADSGDVRVEATAAVLGGALEPVLVPYATLEPLVARWKAGPVALDVVDAKLVAEASGGRSTAELFTMPTEGFPRRRPLGRDPQTVPLAEAWDVVRKVATAADAAGEMKVDWLKDITLTRGYAYATDKYRVHRAALPEGLDTPLRLPGFIITTAVKAKAAVEKLVTDGRRFELVAADCTWVGTLAPVAEVLEAAPALSRPFEAEPVTTFTMDRKALVDAITNVLALKAPSGAVALDASEPGRVILRRAGADIGKAAEEVEATCKGPATTTAFIADNLLGSLKVLDCETVTLSAPENQMGAWRCGDGRLEVGIMPTRV